MNYFIRFVSISSVLISLYATTTFARPAKDKDETYAQQTAGLSEDISGCIQRAQRAIDDGIITKEHAAKACHKVWTLVPVRVGELSPDATKETDRHQNAQPLVMSQALQ